MSEATTPEEPQSEAPEKKSGGGLKLLGGVVGLIGVGASLALMAVPSKEQDHPFKGPYYLPLFEEEFVSNVADDHFTRFLKTSPAVEAFAYDETYTTQRAGDLLYQSWLQNDLGMLLRSMSLEEVYGGTEGQLFALDRLANDVDPNGGDIGRRPGAKRIIVWFGDQPGHDPVCAAITPPFKSTSPDSAA